MPVEVRDCCGESGVLDSTGVGVAGVAAVAGVAVGEGGEGSVGRAMEGFRSHETNALRTRIKLKPIHRILPNDIAYWSPTQGKSARSRSSSAESCSKCSGDGAD
jgi:hypothetical protein